MKTTHRTILILALAAAVLLTAQSLCQGAGKQSQTAVSEDEPARWSKWFRLTDEGIEHMMNRLKETDPNKAEELARLREKDPEKFEAELRKTFRRRFRKKFGQQWGHEARRKSRPHHRRKMPMLEDMYLAGPCEPGKGPWGKEMRQRLGKRHGEARELLRQAKTLDWLRENYPEQAEKLDELKEKMPELYSKKLRHMRKKFGRIFDAEKDHPELAKILKQDLELKQQRDKLLEKIRKTASDDEKKQLTQQLEKLIGDRFDLIVKRKQAKYERLRSRLEKLKQRVNKSQTEAEKWKQLKDQKVKQRLQELLGQTEKFDWD